MRKPVSAPAPKPVRRPNRRQVQIAFRGDPELKIALEAAAAADERTLSQWIAIELRKVLEAKGKKSA